jgi:hypothetical protein
MMSSPITDEFLRAAFERALKTRHDDRFRSVTALVLAEVFEQVAPWVDKEQTRHREQNKKEEKEEKEQK